MPLNRTDSILITLERKRYLVYNYLRGEVVKEIMPIRGNYYRACTDYQFNLKTQPLIILYNASSIRRVDIQTFEIKQSIDMNRISGINKHLGNGKDNGVRPMLGSKNA